MDLECLVVRKLGERAHVPIGGDHQVARGVRKPVQQDESVLAAVNDESLLVVTVGRIAEDAARIFVRLGNVLEAPGSPELLRHRFETTFLVANRRKSCT